MEDSFLTMEVYVSSKSRDSMIFGFFSKSMKVKNGYSLGNLPRYLKMSCWNLMVFCLYCFRMRKDWKVVVRVSCRRDWLY